MPTEEDIQSNCCDASVYIDTDICSECKEHCEVEEIEDDDTEECLICLTKPDEDGYCLCGLTSA